MNITGLSVRITILSLLLSLAIGGLMYSKVQNEKFGMVSSGITISAQSEIVSIYQGDRCVGRMKSEWLTVSDGPELKLSGVVLAGAEFTIDGQVSFNPIGQCLGSVIRVAGPHSKLVVGSKGIFDIEFIVNGTIADRNFKFSLPAKGPIELVRGTKGHTIIYPHTQNVLSLAAFNQSSSFVDSLKSIQTKQGECSVLTPLQIPAEIFKAVNTLQNIGQGPLKGLGR